MSGRVKLIVLVGVLAALVVAALVVPTPTAAELRAWAGQAGWATPVLFLLVYAAFAVAPIPRTVFNLAAGLLLGNVVGVLVAMVATALAAAIAFVLVRTLGGDLVERYLKRDVVRAVNERLRTGPLLAVTSLRLIPAIPFAPMNYACGLSAVPFTPYLVGTVVGSLPGTTATVLLGDALTGTTPPALLACYGVLALAGAVGLVLMIRRTRPAAVRAEPTEPVEVS